MPVFAQLRHTLRALFRRRQLEADLASEFRDHWEQEVAHHLRAGLSLTEAKQAARQLIGPAGLYQEQCRDTRGIHFFENLARDLRYSLRSLQKNAASSLITILALALGIGASTAIYSLARTVVFAPLPYPNADRLVQIQTVLRKTEQPAPWALYADLEDWRARNRTFEGISGYGFAILNLPDDPPTALYGARITYDLFPVLGVRPAFGRNFRPQEDQPGSGQEIILSHSLWRNRFRADHHILGKTIRLIGQKEKDEYVVVGVMPQGFNFPLTIPTSVNPPTRQMAFWIPIAQKPSRKTLTSFTPVGLLRPNTTLQQAQADLSAISAQLERDYPDTNTGRKVRLLPLKDQILGRSKIALILLLAAIGTILAIICANLAHLLLSRVLNRTRESGVRLALGASRFCLLQQWLTESLLLSILGGLGSLIIAKVLLHILLQLAPQAIPRLAETCLDTPAFTFLAFASLVTGLIVGYLPALMAARTDIRAALSGAGTRTTSHLGSIRMRDALIVAEVSLTVVLALGAGLLIKSFARLTSIDPGFSRDHVAMALILLVDRKYPDLSSRVVFARRLLDEVKKHSGISSAGMVDGTPLSGNTAELPIRIEGQPSAERGVDRPIAEVFSVSSDYLATIGIHLRRGRYLNEHDAHSPVVLINQSAAQRFWPHRDALGKRVSLENGVRDPLKRIVIGIITDTRDDNIDQPARPALYIPMDEGVAPPQMLVARVRDNTSESAAAQIIRHAVTALDKNQPVYLITSMKDLYNSSIAERRFTAFLLTVLGVLAIALATLGVYGIVSYNATQRTREIGIRSALGAQRHQVIWLVLSHGLLLSLIGIFIGITVGLLLARYVSGLLYEVTANDFATLTTVTLIITGASLLAGWLPAYRAVLVDPIQSLRHD